MKKADPTDPLFRWSREADQASAPGGPPSGFTTRVLASALSEEPRERDWLLWLLPRAVAMAGALAAATLLPSFVAPRNPSESDLTDLILQSSLPSHP